MSGRWSISRAVDLLLVAFPLRRHLFVHGLTIHGHPKDDVAFLDREVTVALFDADLPRYRQAVLDGTMLHRLRDVELLFAILNMARWHEELHPSLTGQLDGPELLATFASLMLPQGWSVDNATLTELFDVDVVAPRSAAHVGAGWLPQDERIVDAVLPSSRLSRIPPDWRSARGPRMRPSGA